MEDLKNKLTKTFEHLEFDEKKHQYKFFNIKLTPVSYIVSKFYKPFNSSKMALFSARKRGVPIHEILKEWEDKKNAACVLGTNTHLFAENWTPDSTFSNGYEESVCNYFKALKEAKNGFNPLLKEFRMFSQKLLIAGTCDKIDYNKETNEFKLIDFKGLPLNTDIFTNNGWKTIGTLTIDDKIYDKDGQLCSIKNISNIHHKKCLKMKFDNGEEIISDFEHRWLIHFKNGQSYNGKPYIKEVIMTTQELYDYLQKYPDRISKHIPKILNAAPLYNEKIDLPIDPYLFGIWLGDGHSIDGKITQANRKVWIEIQNRGYQLGKDVSQGGAGKAETRSVFGLETQLRLLNLKNNKHIPDIFLQSSYEQRLDLLRGLMDADGHFHKTRKRYVIATTKENQVDFTIKLLGSLGIKPTVFKVMCQCNDKKIPGYHICFSTNLNVFLSRNQDIDILNLIQKDNFSYRNIIEIKEVETIPTKCIEVDSKSHTYLFGKTFITTHNTNSDLYKNFKGQMLLEPFNKMLDTPFNKYQIQLALYQMLFELTGEKIAKRELVWFRPDGTFLILECDDLTPILKEYFYKEYLC